MSEPVRDRIVGIASCSLAETIYVGAGAGTGKTQALVERIANLVTRGGVKPDNIAAITFTVAAASELRQRVREELERRLEKTRGIELAAEKEELRSLSAALDSLDSAYIGTIHSFAQSLLRERPLDVDLPPVFEVLDEVQGNSLFDEEWDQWLADELSKQEFAEAVINAQRLGLRSPLATLRELAEELHRSYDIVVRVGALLVPDQAINLPEYLSSIRSDLAAALDLRHSCGNLDDLMFQHLEREITLAVSWIDEALAERGDSGGQVNEECILALTQLPKLSISGGRKGDWGALNGGDSSLDEVRALLKSAQGTLESGRQAFGETTVVPLINAVARMVLGYSEKRRKEGLLEFQDLLVFSCQLLIDSPEARRYFQTRYTHILIDEFQDTDPLQLQLAVLLSGGTVNAAGTPTPGALFVVGDGKQSIYRFRGADLTQLQALLDLLGATQLSLATNYRSNPEILNWVNAIFAPWMNGPGGTTEGTYNPRQARYEPLEPGRADNSEQFDTVVPRVMIMGDAADGNVDEAREAEAADIALLARNVGAGNWQLVDRNGKPYNSRFSDLCVLIPRRTGLPVLEAAFDAHQVPYVLEGQAPIFESQTFHELGNNLAAIDDPTDQVAIVAALKSVAWGCSDQDLFDWARAGLKFEYAHFRPKVNDYPEGSGARKIAGGLVGLGEFHDRRQEDSTPYLIEHFIRKRRLREVAALMNPSGERERLMDLFIEMSRSLQRSGTGSLREFVRWLSGQAEAGVRVAEGALSNSDVNAVRVMTIYAAKGLEFPIVTLAGLQVRASAPRGSSVVRYENGTPVLAVKLGPTGLGLSTRDYEKIAASEKDADEAELVRLAYVGATRSREHLVVSVHRSATDRSTLAAKIGGFAEQNRKLWQPFAPGPDDVVRPSSEDSIGLQKNEKYSFDNREDWIRELNDVIRAARSRGYVSPSQLADHSMFDTPKPEENSESTELNVARRGRGGTDFGSAVHSVLQDIDFDDLSNLEDLAKSAVDSYSIAEQHEDIAKSVSNVLDSPVVRSATPKNSWREAWVAAEIIDESFGGSAVEVEGSIDLIIRNEDGTVTIVDYKTDRVSGEDLLARAKGYEPQLAGYALALEKQGMQVRDAVLVFADGGPTGTAFEYRVPDLDAAKRQATARIQQLVG
ncbi:MAG: UvrD-helicase domain-containing protein [Chloroflexi bacterium]|nr:UvrD-helicase domain-containing protein [Chloroflexota bacterium]